MTASRRAARAFSLMELTVATVVLTVAMLGVLAAVAGADQARQTSRETEAATRALQDTTERYRGLGALGFTAALEAAEDDSSWQALPADQLAPTGPYAGLPSGTERRVEVLDEAEVSKQLGLDAAPLDLDGDGVAGEDASGSEPGTYRVLPLRVTVRWPQRGGKQRQVGTITLLYPRSTQ